MITNIRSVSNISPSQQFELIELDGINEGRDNNTILESIMREPLMRSHVLKVGIINKFYRDSHQLITSSIAHVPGVFAGTLCDKVST